MGAERRPRKARGCLFQAIGATALLVGLVVGVMATRTPRLGIYEDECFDPEPAPPRQFMMAKLFCTCAERELDAEQEKARRVHGEELRREERELHADVEALERRRATLDRGRDTCKEEASRCEATQAWRSLARCFERGFAMAAWVEQASLLKSEIERIDRRIEAKHVANEELQRALCCF